MSTNFWKQKVWWHHQGMFTPQANFPANDLNFHWRWRRWWDQIQAIFLNLFSFIPLLNSPQPTWHYYLHICIMQKYEMKTLLEIKVRCKPFKYENRYSCNLYFCNWRLKKADVLNLGNRKYSPTFVAMICICHWVIRFA